MRTSLVEAPAELALREVGFAPLGDVMGCAVMTAPQWSQVRCDYFGWTTPGTSRVRTDPTSTGILRNGFTLARDRLIQEAASLGAHGAIGAVLELRPLGTMALEFVLRGTAVTAPGAPLPPQPFTTHLGAAETASLLAAGHVPVGLIAGVDVAVRHDDYVGSWQFGNGPFGSLGNVEIPGYTDLVTQTRDRARQRLREQVKQSGADGAILHTVQLRIRAVEVADNHRDHIAQTLLLGTSIATFSRRPTRDAAHALTVLPLRPTTAPFVRRKDT